MDADGARHLHFRIEQQRQWRQAAAVCRGLQATVDPDLDRLEGIGDGVRHYRAGSHAAPLEKRLLQGWWHVVEPYGASATPLPAARA